MKYYVQNWYQLVISTKRKHLPVAKTRYPRIIMDTKKIMKLSRFILSANVSLCSRIQMKAQAAQRALLACCHFAFFGLLLSLPDC
jgi:hypothetical protein